MADYIEDSYLGRMPRDYFSTLDRREYVPAPRGTGKPVTGVKNLGISTPPMQDQVQTLKQRIYQGASLVELGFMGSGKGSMGQGSTTPGMYGKEHRQAMRELAKTNDIKLTTHVTTRMAPLSGFTQQGFNEEARRQALEEMERTIDFAADVARGGPVTVHTGEFDRRISRTRGGFTKYERFEGSQPEYFVDAKDGRVIADVRDDEKIFWPEMERDEQGRLVTDPDTGMFVPKYDYDKKGLDMHEINDRDITAIQDHYEKQRGIRITPDEAKARAKIESQMRNAEAWARQSETRIGAEKARIKDLSRMKEDLLSDWDESDDRKKEIYKESVLREFIGREPPRHLRGADAIEILNELIREQQASLSYNQDVASNYYQQSLQMRNVLDNMRTVEEYAKEKTADTLAQAGLYAREKSKRNRFGEQTDPIFISPENIFPERYGGHPDELREIVQSSRKAMADHLVAKEGMSPDKAKKTAAQHIKATFDIGHANMWKKYYEGPEEEFNKWIVKQAEKLAEEGIIGHVHVTDNLGFNDEHLSPGQGNAPINEFVEKMKKHGVHDVIVEPAHQDFQALQEGWRTMAGSIGTNFPVAGDRWTNIEHSYFGRTAGPYFIYGDFAPSQEGYQLWSGVRLE